MMKNRTRFPAPVWARSLGLLVLAGATAASAATPYQGMVNRTRSGRECQRWASDSPHRHGFKPGKMNYSKLGIGYHNYCRNPDNSAGPWCFTTDPRVRWEFCNVPIHRLTVGRRLPTPSVRLARRAPPRWVAQIRTPVDPRHCTGFDGTWMNKGHHFTIRRSGGSFSKKYTARWNGGTADLRFQMNLYSGPPGRAWRPPYRLEGPYKLTPSWIPQGARTGTLTLFLSRNGAVLSGRLRGNHGGVVGTIEGTGCRL